MNRSRDFKIDDVGQIQLLRSTVRQEIVDTVHALRECSLREVAEYIGRPADGLYYHANALIDGGLLVKTGEKETDRRPEATYSTPSKGILRMRYKPQDASHSNAVSNVVTSMLKTANRDFAQGLKPKGARCTGPERNLNASRQKAWLNKKQLKKVNSLLAKIQDIFANMDAEQDAELHSFTFVLAPIKPSETRRTTPSKDS
ncbi:MAG: helix-turn-helix transcriptional regulator [Phycisphaerales bacterium]|nr:helix-turn-helix transcriptional regulator [Phycisphaerales bacterium]